jgi:hypothetical protein
MVTLACSNLLFVKTQQFRKLTMELVNQAETEESVENHQRKDNKHKIKRIQQTTIA